MTFVKSLLNIYETFHSNTHIRPRRKRTIRFPSTRSSLSSTTAVPAYRNKRRNSFSDSSSASGSSDDEDEGNWYVGGENGEGVKKFYVLRPRQYGIPKDLSQNPPTSSEVVQPALSPTSPTNSFFSFLAFPSSSSVVPPSPTTQSQVIPTQPPTSSSIIASVSPTTDVLTNILSTSAPNSVSAIPIPCRSPSPISYSSSLSSLSNSHTYSSHAPNRQPSIDTIQNPFQAMLLNSEHISEGVNSQTDRESTLSQTVATTKPFSTSLPTHLEPILYDDIYSHTAITSSSLSSCEVAEMSSNYDDIDGNEPYDAVKSHSENEEYDPYNCFDPYDLDWDY